MSTHIRGSIHGSERAAAGADDHQYRSTHPLTHLLINTRVSLTLCKMDLVPLLHPWHITSQPSRREPNYGERRTFTAAAFLCLALRWPVSASILACSRTRGPGHARLAARRRGSSFIMEHFSISICIGLDSPSNHLINQINTSVRRLSPSHPRAEPSTSSDLGPSLQG